MMTNDQVKKIVFDTIRLNRVSSINTIQQEVYLGGDGKTSVYDRQDLIEEAINWLIFNGKIAFVFMPNGVGFEFLEN